MMLKYFANKEKILTFFCMICIMLFMLFHQLWHSGFIIDDAFITFRYSENMSNGYGLVFNPGERVEGYSNLLWALINGIAIWANIDPIIFSRIVSYLCGIGIVFLIFRISCRVEFYPKKRSVLIAPFLFALWCPSAFWANSGLETIFFSFLLLAGVDRLLASAEKPSLLLLSGFIFGLAAITRPEGVGYIIVILLYIIGENFYKKTKYTIISRRVMLFITGAAIILLPAITWRYLYYNELIPNTVYAKSSIRDILHGRSVFVLPALLLFKEGSPYILNWILSLGLGMPFLFLFFSLLSKKLIFNRAPAAIILLGGLIVTWWNCGDWMPYSRLLSPVTPFLIILAQAGINDMIVICDQKNKIYLKYFLQFLLLVVIPGLFVKEFISNGHKVESWTEERMPLGLALAKVAKPESTLATTMAGVIPYYSKLYTIDALGLNDKYIARHGISMRRWGKTDWEYVLSRKPDIWHTVGREAVIMTNIPGFVNNYFLIKIPESLAIIYGCDNLFIHKDSPSLEDFINKLNATIDPAIEVLNNPCFKEK